MNILHNFKVQGHMNDLKTDRTHYKPKCLAHKYCVGEIIETKTTIIVECNFFYYLNLFCLLRCF